MGLWGMCYPDWRGRVWISFASLLILWLYLIVRLLFQGERQSLFNEKMFVEPYLIVYKRQFGIRKMALLQLEEIWHKPYRLYCICLQISTKRTVWTIFCKKSLTLSGIEVYDSKVQPNGDIHIFVESTKKSIPCRICGKETTSYGENQEIKLRHLPILGKKTYIILTPLRGKCDSCDGNPTSNQRHDWYEYKARQTSGSVAKNVLKL